MCLFEDLKQIAEKYIQKMSVWDVGILKLCLCSLGVLIGTGISRPPCKKAANIFCGIAFAFSWFYLITTFVLHCVTEIRSITAGYNKDF